MLKNSIIIIPLLLFHVLLSFFSVFELLTSLYYILDNKRY